MRCASPIALLVTAAASLAGCGASQKPAEAPARQERVAELEERVAALERALDAMRSQRHVASGLVSRLDQQESRIAAIEEKQEEGAPSRPTRRRKRRRPQRNEVYAVPIGSSPCLGAKHARVTMIEAFEFA